MKNNFLKPYKNLSKEIWILSLITLINRAGAMVIPFLSLYLTKSLGFTLSDVGTIMTFYGFGSFFGTWLGGKLTDLIGYHKVMYISLFFGSLLFFILQYLETFWQFALGIFILILIVDLFRPAMWVAIQDYSTNKNKTRSVTLIRLAINLGFSFGPAIAGLIIATIGYKGLFWADALTTLIAAILMYLLLTQKTKLVQKTKEEIKKQTSPYRDFQFIIFWFAIFLMGVSFVQFIEVLPLFYHDVINLDEKSIGLLLALNGFIIFLTEMPIVTYLEKKYNHIKLVIYGLILFALSFLILNLYHSVFVAFIGMLLLTFGEIFSFPFSNTYAMERSKKGNQGAYMAFYAMTFSAAFIIGPKLGMHLVDNFGYGTLWYSVTAILALSIILMIWLSSHIKNE